MASSEEEEDYMTMTFPDDPTTTVTTTSSLSGRGETSLQRRQRLRREAEARARPKSKAELAAEEEARREAALSQSLIASQPKSKGLAMMAKMGFTGGALGKKKEAVAVAAAAAATAATTTGGVGDGERTRAGGGGITEPIRISIKDGREGIGLESERKRKLREAAEAAGEKAKRAKADEGEYRERLRREREEKRWEGQVVGAQKVAERMAAEAEEKGEGKDGDGKEGGPGRGLASRPLKSIPVVWRGLVRAREEAERDRRMRYDLEQGLSRLPTYEDAEEDEDDKKALGKATARTTCVTAEDLDEEDSVLDEFNALPADERLRRLVLHLREKHHYCFWCKFTYPDDTMEGCPGLTEEDHD
ncbi:G-patch domain-containing protein [Madurella fahalii]|uniref:G-patch domain-containing protein n=1 Tax=Madurella fahalii TaxID=1157608 RepID=A0ABQ0G0M0_9PEZI